ncbi:MAG TPA: PIN domain-containing protein [Planctomycetaceae bacterium]|nr:PIN domain-containing protein [Planctomycetaceae bacterium]
MTLVFLDTVGLLAVWNMTDQWHAAAEPVFAALQTQEVRLVTTSLVLYECGNAAARRPYRRHVSLLRETMGLAGDLHEPTPGDVEAAWLAYRQGSSGDAGIVDLISFAVMRRLGITQAFTNDQHFTAAGFETLF